MHSLLTALGNGVPNRNSAHGLQSARHQKRPLTAVPLGTSEEKPTAAVDLLHED
jgi:hypothetical protein